MSEIEIPMQETDKTPHAFRAGGELGAHAIMLEALQETETLIPEISQARKETFFKRIPGRKYAKDCSDDREPTSDAVDMFQREYDVELSEMVRRFGAAYGDAFDFAVALVVQSDESILETLPKDFNQFVIDHNALIEAANPDVLQTGHSAAGNEGNSEHFNPSSDKPVACAYAAGIASVSQLGSKESIADTARQEQHEMFGSDKYVDKIRDAYAAVGQYFFGGLIARGETGLSRQDYTDIDMPVVVLEGAHAPHQPNEEDPESRAITVMNFTIDELSNPSVANSKNIPYYNVDATQVALETMKAYPNVKLDPEILLATISYGSLVTRAALDGNGGDTLRAQKYGDPQTALDYLRGIQSAL